MKKSIKQKLINNNEVLIGSWITIGHPTIAEIMCKAGFDWLAIDLEHSTIGLRECEELIRIIDLSNVSPLVRLTSNNSDQIKRVLDAGCHGIIVPMINNAEDAMLAISSSRYPPYGTRGVGLARAQGYGNKFNDYMKWQKENLIVIVQIEHIDAVNNLEEILSVDGVDGYIVGPYDLSASINKPGEFEDKEFLELLKKIKTIGNDLKKPGGIHIVEPDKNKLKDSINDQNNFIAYSVDIRMIDCISREGINIKSTL
jgi:2-dehydro-3-deoxyglucarate aldolase